ncbi:PDR/VanB family oxidoreductase [Sodalis sp. RH23]|uniref:PDR/VanB family oxidoreductase n=1 Tax=unclassified Sodalis (in: enterobacteria) TaxID=2636512 RepID=UPI0039B63792
MNVSQHFFEVMVVAKSHRGDGVVFLTLARSDGAPLPPFSAGAHIQLRLADGLLRQYSLCGDPARRDSYRLAILAARRSRGGGSYIRDSLQRGDSLWISAPRNDFPLAERREPALLLAGGIGITPLLAMALTLRAQGREFGLHYYGRPDTLGAFMEQPDYTRLARHIVPHCRDGAAPADADYQQSLAVVIRDWQRRHGRFSLYFCGSLPFMQSVRDQCAAAEIPAEACFYESFTPPEVRGETTFDVEIFSTGAVIPIPADLSIAEALNQAGVAVEVSCGLGVCGTCLAGVKAGIPDHRDEYLSAAQKDANNKIMLCCSRARSTRLVIDL